MLREWLVRMRDVFLMRGSNGGGAPAPAPRKRRRQRTPEVPQRGPEQKNTTYRDPNKCLEAVHTEETHISPEDALIPVLGALVMTVCWGYYLVITSPPLPDFITAWLPSFLK